MADGTKLYCEQTGYKPTKMSSVLLEGKNGEFRMYGNFNMKASLNSLNSVIGWREGKVTLEFADGTVYNMDGPKLVIQNVVMCEQYQYFKGFGMIEDSKNNLYCQFTYSPWEVQQSGLVVGAAKKAWGWLGSKLSRSKATEEPADGEIERPKRYDDIQVSIFKRE